MEPIKPDNRQFFTPRPLVSRYNGMIQRCYNPNQSHYKHYGGRGISVCEEWRNNRSAFIQWANENGFKRELQIDRIDNDGNYCPENCRWITKKEQEKNTRRSVTNWEKQTRICYKCKIEKPWNEFYKTHSLPAGHEYICKECTKAIKRQKRLKAKAKKYSLIKL